MPLSDAPAEKSEEWLCLIYSLGDLRGGGGGIMEMGRWVDGGRGFGGLFGAVLPEYRIRWTQGRASASNLIYSSRLAPLPIVQLQRLRNPIIIIINAIKHS